MGRTTARELYDLARDPYELRNRATDRRYRDTRRTLAGALERLDHCSGPECALDVTVPGPRG